MEKIRKPFSKFVSAKKYPCKYWLSQNRKILVVFNTMAISLMEQAGYITSQLGYELKTGISLIKRDSGERNAYTTFVKNGPFSARQVAKMYSSTHKVYLHRDHIGCSIYGNGQGLHIVSNTNMQDLINQVENMIYLGYELLGGIQIVRLDSGTFTGSATLTKK